LSVKELHVYQNTFRLSVVIKYSMRNLICDVMNYCASSFATGKLSAYNLIVTKT